MAQTVLSVWPEDFATPLEQDTPVEAAVAAMAAGDQLSLTLLDTAGKPLTKPIPLKRPRARRFETSGPNGQMAWTRAVPPLSIPIDYPSNAETIRLSSGAFVRDLPIALAAAADPGAPIVRTFGTGSGWTLLLVSEMFSDQERFFAHCRALHDFIVGEPPFNEQAVRSRLRIDALFWPSGPAGLFNTRFMTDDPNDRRCFGDGKLVRRRLKKAKKKGDKVIVLIDSSKRGGAGGVGKDPAWSTITGNPGERWEDIALHELGHSLGLADEYTASGPVGKATEPNVTDRSNAAQAPWAAMRSPQIPHNPTCRAGQDCSGLAGKVGTFEGARYKPQNLYRPSWDCRMNHAIEDFCAVCQAHIRAVITG